MFAAVAIAVSGLPSVLQVVQEGTAEAGVSGPAGPTDESKVPHYFGPYPNWANSPQAIPNAVVTITGDGTGAAATATVDPKTGGIASVTVTEPGTGYTTAAVAITAPGMAPTPAVASATLSTGAITSISVLESGFGFVQPVVTIGDGTGAQARAVGGVDNLTLIDGGAGYLIQPIVEIGLPDDTVNGVQATAVATMDASGVVNGISVVEPGAGYYSAPTVTIVDGNGAATTPATVQATIGISSIEITAAGAAYPSAPAVTITDANDGVGVPNPDHGASAVANVAVAGAVTAITVTSPGSGYITPGLKKFVDTLPGLGAGNANNLGQYIPVGVPDTTTYPGTDYYEIGIVQYTMKFHRDLPPTSLRGYVQLSTSVIPGLHVPLVNENVKRSDGLGGPVVEVDEAVTLNGNQVYGVDNPHYLGPTIVATKDRPVRILFRNLLPNNEGGDLFLPVDTTLMGAGMAPGAVQLDANGVPITDPAENQSSVMDEVRNPMCGKEYNVGERTHCFSQNRAELHLHGGITPWISDGTPHQWITPANESTLYPKGVSVSNVPDMPDPGPGAMTFFYTNQQSARLMFYHDHAWGITRLNVYAGEAAGYLITDEVEQSLFGPTGLFPDLGLGTPLVIQDKTFVPSDAQMAKLDPTWDKARWGGEGSLWVPHVYMPAQNPGDPSGMSGFGRWMYGPFFWPPATPKYGPIPNPYDGWGIAADGVTKITANCDPATASFCEPKLIPGTPNVTVGMEAFNDTPIVNGTAYPTTTVDPKTYRYRILNAANDRFWNLSWYVADPTTGTLSEVALNAAELEAAQTDPVVFPTPDTTKSPAGPNWVQIGTEGGFLPTPVVVPAHPTTWITDPTRFDVGNVDQHSLLLAPAERADVIVDFSQYRGKTLILYNDAPAAFPARVPGYDYYTGGPDLSPAGAPTTLPGYGPNTRTIMQVKVSNAAPAVAFDRPNTTNDRLGQLMAEFAHQADGSGVFERGQNPIIVGQASYNEAYGTNFVANGWCNAPGAAADAPCDGYARISEQGVPGFRYKFDTVAVNPTPVEDGYTNGPKIDLPFEPKGIHDEMNSATFDEFGRMTANLGLEAPGATPLTQNIILYPYTNPATELLNSDGMPSSTNVTPISTNSDGTQIWKITHNGVDTHPIHFHLYDVQVLNRVAWDNIISPPDPNELGWKDTVRMNPLQDTIIAVRPIIPTLPFAIPDSYRVPNPMMPAGARGSQNGVRGTEAGFNNTDTLGRPIAPIVNARMSFDWEYVYHCHILSHEEMDMMRPVNVHVGWNAPVAPTLGVPVTGNGVTLNWTDGTPVQLTPADANGIQNIRLDLLNMKGSEIGFYIERAPDNFDPLASLPDDPLAGHTPGAWAKLANSDVVANGTTYTDTTAVPNTNYWYRVVAWNDAQTSESNLVADETRSNEQLVLAGGVVVRAASTTALTASVNPSLLNQSVTFTATVSDATVAAGTPTGDVTFTQKIGNNAPTTLGTVALVNGVATISTASIPVGNATITASYPGDAGFFASADFLVQTVNKAASSTTVASSSPTAAVGQPVTFTATVAPPDATGSVTFTFDKGTPSAFTTAPQAVTAGSATYAISSLTIGTHTVEATYSGDGNYSGSTSASINQVITVITTTTALTSSANPSGALLNVNLTATVTPAAGAAPNGTVTFTITNPAAADTVATVSLVNGVAVYSSASLSLGSHVVTAQYNGLAGWQASTSAPLTQVIEARATTTSLTSSTGGAAITYPAAVTYTATVTPVIPGGVPTGSVVFTISNPLVATDTVVVPLDGTGSATLADYVHTAGGDPGVNTVTATYQPSTVNWLASASASLTQNVFRAFTTLTVLRSTATSRVGEPVTFMALVGPPGTGGTVSFWLPVNGVPTKAITVPVAANGSAFWTTNGLPLGTTTVSVIFDGTVNYLHAGWVTLTQSVTRGNVTVAVTSDQNPIPRGQVVTFTATVSPVAPATATPFGEVRFYDNSNNRWIGNWTVIDASGRASVSTSTLRGGRTTTIRAFYRNAAGWYNTSTSPRYYQVVT
ncbi:MAG: Ig-like domain repeat protein [Actinobacteria bacterium]|nr:Ig-like domain repeat protein [Actinomycetota bacterium]